MKIIHIILLWTVPACFFTTKSCINVLKKHLDEVTISNLFREYWNHEKMPRFIAEFSPILVIIIGTMCGWCTLFLLACIKIYNLCKDVKL